MKSEQEIYTVYKRFKRKVSEMNLKPKIKEKVFYEFKSTLLDNNYQKIKVRMLTELLTIKNTVIYSTYVKKEEKFNQEKKEKVYLKLISKIVCAINNPITVIFDSFNKPNFESEITNSLLQFSHVEDVIAKNSYDSPRIQFVDNLSSVVRHSYLDSKNKIVIDNRYGFLTA